MEQTEKEEDISKQTIKVSLCHFTPYQHKIMVKSQAEQPTNQFLAGRTAIKVSYISHVRGLPNTQASSLKGRVACHQVRSEIEVQATRGRLIVKT